MEEGKEVVPRADLIDGELFIETAETLRATAALWALLRVSRQAKPWLPLVVLCGEHGTGKSTLTRRFSAAARREAACGLLAEGPADRPWADLGPAWDREMTLRHGACPRHCNPALLAAEPLVIRALREAADTHPTVGVDMTARPDRQTGFMFSPAWQSPGNKFGHPTRRTSLCLVDGADRLLSVPPSRRRAALDALREYPGRMVAHAVAVVLIGSPALAAAVSDWGTTQIIRLDAMQPDDGFAEVVSMIFGTREGSEVAALHQASSGRMGALMHLARMAGLEPPYTLRPDEIRSLPGPAAGEPG